MIDPHTHSERRTLIFCAVGAVLGLVVAGAGLFTAQGTRIAGVPPEDVATVNQAPVLMSDYITALQASEGVGLDQATPQQKRKVLDQMIREELYVQRGVELGLQNDVIEVRQALVGAVEGQQAVDAAATQPDEAFLRDLYRRNIGRYTGEGLLAVEDMVAPSLAQAQAAVAALRAGQPLARVRQAQHLSPSGRMADGEEFYFAAQIHLGDRLFKAVEGLRGGEVSDPVPLPDGVHVAVVVKNTPPVVAPFDQVRDRVLADYRADKVARMQAGADAFLRKRADIQIAPGFE
jgi:parvulin-like peptidyl-prolyl isomerase